MSSVVANSPSGHRRLLVDEHLAAALDDEPRRPRLGHPRALHGVGLERRRASASSPADGSTRRRHRSVSALKPVVLEVRAQRDVLRVAERRRRQHLALEVCRAVDVGLHDERRATRGRAGDDAQGLAVRLHIAVHRRVRADVPRVDRAGEQSLDLLGAGVEDRRLQVDVRAQGLGVRAVPHAHEGGAVRDVREVPQREGDLLSAVGRCRRSDVSGDGRTARVGGVRPC